jgi:hypothetical protein
MTPRAITGTPPAQSRANSTVGKTVRPKGRKRTKGSKAPKSEQSANLAAAADAGSPGSFTPDELQALVEAATHMTASAAGREILRLIVERKEASDSRLERERELVDLMMPPVGELTTAATTQLLWNAQARAEALSEFGALTAAELEAIRGLHTDNPHATPARWLREQRVFAIDAPGGRRFPAFQFVDGQPKGEVARVLAALHGELRGWELLLWFTSSSGQLGGRRPVDVLDGAPEEAVAAAAFQASLSED